MTWTDRRPRRAVPAEALLARLGHLLTSLWAAEDTFIDPFGQPRSSSPTQPRPAQPLNDNGSFIDPFG